MLIKHKTEGACALAVSLGSGSTNITWQSKELGKRTRLNSCPLQQTQPAVWEHTGVKSFTLAPIRIKTLHSKNFELCWSLPKGWLLWRLFSKIL